MESRSNSRSVVRRPRRCDLDDRRRAHIDQRNVRTVVDLIVAGIEAQALGTDGMIIGAEQLGHSRILDDAADLLAHELGGRLVGLFIDKEIAVAGQEADGASVLPEPLIINAPFLVGRF